MSTGNGCWSTRRRDVVSSNKLLHKINIYTSGQLLAYAWGSSHDGVGLINSFYTSAQPLTFMGILGVKKIHDVMS